MAHKEMENPTTQKYRIIIKGNVINVGYRAFVRQVAINLGVHGLVRNKKDYVEIYCEVDNKKQLNSFLNRLVNIRNPTDSEFYDPFQVEISGEPTIFPENSDEYKINSPPSPFEYPFTIDYGFNIKTIKPVDRETIESLNAGKAIMITKFGYLDHKYDKISTNISGVSSGLRNIFIVLGVSSILTFFVLLFIVVKIFF